MRNGRGRHPGRWLAGVVVATVVAGVVPMAPVAAEVSPDGRILIPYERLVPVDADLAVDADERTYLSWVDRDADEARVLRVTAAGEIDPSYGTDGVASIPVPQGWSEVVVVATGEAYVGDATDGAVRVRRLTAAGQPDATYGTAGQIVGAPGWGLDIGPDGSVVGLATETDPDRFSARRWDAAGSPDPSYGGDGTAELPTDGNPDVEVQLLDDGHVVTSGTDGGTSRLLHLDEHGALLGAADVVGPRPGRAHLAPDGSLWWVRQPPAGGALVTHRSADLATDGSFGGDGTVEVEGQVVAVHATGERLHVVTERASDAGPHRRTLEVTALDTGGIDEAFGDGGTARSEVAPTSATVDRPAFFPSAGPDGRRGTMLTWHAWWRPTSADDYLGRALEVDATGAIVGERAIEIVLEPVADHDGASVVLKSTDPPNLGASDSWIGALRRLDLDALAIHPFSSRTAFAAQVVADVTGRPATPAEIAAVEGALAAGRPAATVIGDLVGGPPWSSNLEPVVRLYWAYFGRPPDPTGLAYWIGRRDAGLTVARISAVFADSSEFRRTYGSLTNRQFVELVYRNVLGRDGDPAGIAFWTGRLDRRATSRGHLMASFSESSEHVRQRAAAVATISRYLALLGRTPTADELERWSGEHPLGDADALARDLLASDEYAARVQP